MRQRNRFRLRLGYTAAFVVLMLIEGYIALYVHDAFVRPYIGDVLVVLVVYCMVRTAVPEGIRHLPLWVFLFAAMVEVLQYFDLVHILGMEDNYLARIVLGSVADGKDVVCYGVGCLGLWLWEKMGRYREAGEERHLH